MDQPRYANTAAGTRGSVTWRPAAGAYLSGRHAQPRPAGKEPKGSPEVPALLGLPGLSSGTNWFCPYSPAPPKPASRTSLRAVGLGLEVVQLLLSPAAIVPN